MQLFSHVCELYQQSEIVKKRVKLNRRATDNRRAQIPSKLFKRRHCSLTYIYLLHTQLIILHKCF